ncbi:MAG TPA: hypothetical protein VJ728_03170, partial [Candidatus Binataceae bacterium]|nr:hypothetical protein [Candidatus Binataceae bacterium]
AVHKFHNLNVALRHVYEYASRSILVWGLGISMVFALYFALIEINVRMGEGQLWKLFFESRTTAESSSLRSNIGSGER